MDNEINLEPPPTIAVQYIIMIRKRVKYRPNIDINCRSSMILDQYNYFVFYVQGTAQRDHQHGGTKLEQGHQFVSIQIKVII